MLRRIVVLVCTSHSYHICAEQRRDPAERAASPYTGLAQDKESML
jgi:hypothetical protein